ncbi:MAG: NAD(P)/FAD-dependent oxidoreductase [Aestuariivirgaceae bacterium]
MTAISFLPSNDASNGWNRLLPPRAPMPSLEGRTRADWIVVGAGFAGLAAARRLAENRPTDSIALIEAHEVAENASGRNSGFVLDLPHNVGAAPPEIETTRRHIRLNRAAITHLETAVRSNTIDCGWSRRGKYHAAVSAEGTEEILKPFATELGALGEPLRWLDAKELERELGTSYYHAAVYTPGCVLLNPAALTRGLAATLPDNIRLYENSPVVVAEYGRDIELATPHGFIRAPRMILAVNGFAAEFGFFRRHLLRFAVFASLTRPLTESEHAALAGTEDWGLTPANAFVSTTMRLTPDHRILIGHHISYAPWHGVTDRDLARARKKHRRVFLKRFPMLSEVTFEHTWAGYVCLSRNSAPGFGRAATNIWTSVCQNADGVTKGTISGLLAADMEALGRPERLPPQPFCTWGVRIANRWNLWRNRHEA